MTPSSSSARVTHESDPPDLLEVVRFYPTAAEVLKAYIESDFHARLATEHERHVAVVTEEGAAVTDVVSYTRVGERLVEVVRHRKAVEAWFKPLAELADRFHKVITGRRADVLQPLVAFEEQARANVNAFDREEERKRLEQEQRDQAEARAREQRRLEEEAALLEDRGEGELAALVLEEALHAPAPVVTRASTVPLIKGLTPHRPNYKWRPLGGDTPDNRARALKLVPREYLDLSDKKLNAYAKAHGASGRIPGIEIYDAGTVQVRS